MRGPGEHVSFDDARAPSSGLQPGSHFDGTGAGLAESIDYTSMIPDPALRQSFSQNVEEVRTLHLPPGKLQLSILESGRALPRLCRWLLSWETLASREDDACLRDQVSGAGVPRYTEGTTRSATCLKIPLSRLTLLMIRRIEHTQRRGVLSW